MDNTIASLIEALKKSEDLSFESMERILAEHLPSREEIIAVTTTELPYGRTMLHLDNELEVIIGCWPRGGWCDAHDHGNAIGIVYAYGGEIEHFRYEFDGGVLDLVEHEKMKANESYRLEKGMIHSLQNMASDEPYIGLHIYAPPTSDVRVFDLKSGDIYHVTDDYPALIPKEQEKIVKHEKEMFTFKNSVRAKL
jgi:predicted metal-dependent enzyme (double-stranded beta helix superfamily)